MSNLDYFSWSSSFHRLLNETEEDDDWVVQNANFTDDDMRQACKDFAASNDGAVLRDTFRIYGTLFALCLIAFCYLRKAFPKAYNTRSWVEDIKTELADDQHGLISWIWKLFRITDTEMLDECGMDALCYTRVLEFGLKLSLVGVCNAIWLIPVYATAKGDRLTDCIRDPIVSITVSHIPSGSARYCATVVGCYIIFGFAMYSILEEFEWFIRYRHQYLSKPLARNYAVYVQCIPQEYRTNSKFLQFFESASTQGAVMDAHLAVKIPNLQNKVAQREALVAKLERAINLEEMESVSLRQRLASLVGQNHSFLSSGLLQLQELNQSIATSIDIIERIADETIIIPENEEEEIVVYEDQLSPRGEEEPEYTLPMVTDYGSADEMFRPPSPTFEPVLTGDSTSTSASTRKLEVPDSVEEAESPHEEKSRKDLGAAASLLMTANRGVKKLKTAAEAAGSNVAGNVKNVAGNVKHAAGSVAGNVKNVAGNVAGNVKNVAGNVAGNVVSAAGNVAMMFAVEDGRPLSAGFVTFNSLRSAQAALQMIQHPEPFAMEVLEAPQPEDVFWQNVGKTHQELQIGKLISIGLTTTLCFFWTIPMGFISTLSSIEGLRGSVKIIDEMLNDYPWLEPLLAQLAPLLIVFANEFLKILLEVLSGLEGPISGAVVQAKLFSKLAAFMIIQTFFVTAIGGSLVTSLRAMLEQPELIVDTLAQSLPSQSTLYIQILLVDTFLNMSLELLRAIPLGMDFARKFIGPRSTEKERSTTYMGIRPLCDPTEFEHANLLSGTVLYFMVYFVYATIAPFTTVFMFVCFMVMAAGYRHQLVYIYPTFPDSGGKLLAAFLRLLPGCMIVAQITIVGMLALSQAAAASAMMFPLLACTILFTMYIQQKHFVMTEFLPSKDAFAVDLKSAETGLDYSFVRDKYVQPELRQRELLPENLTVEREMDYGCLHFSTPPGSDAGDAV